MPELPEVQTVINHLLPYISDRIIQSVETPHELREDFENGIQLDYKIRLNNNI